MRCIFIVLLTSMLFVARITAKFVITGISYDFTCETGSNISKMHHVEKWRETEKGAEEISRFYITEGCSVLFNGRAQELMLNDGEYLLIIEPGPMCRKKGDQEGTYEWHINCCQGNSLEVVRVFVLKDDYGNTCYVENKQMIETSPMDDGNSYYYLVITVNSLNFIPTVPSQNLKTVRNHY